MRSFFKVFGLFGYQILMDFHVKFGMKVVDMRFYDIYSVFSNEKKNFGFYKVFPKNIGFLFFLGSKAQNFEISR